MTQASLACLVRGYTIIQSFSFRLIVFCGALSALGLMTFLSVCLGYATMIIPREVTFYSCTALLALFGLKMLYEGWKMSPDEGLEEYEEVSAELRRREEMVRRGELHTYSFKLPFQL